MGTFSAERYPYDRNYSLFPEMRIVHQIPNICMTIAGFALYSFVLVTLHAVVAHGTIDPLASTLGGLVELTRHLEAPFSLQGAHVDHTNYYASTVITAATRRELFT